MLLRRRGMGCARNMAFSCAGDDVYYLYLLSGAVRSAVIYCLAVIFSRCTIYTWDLPRALLLGREYCGFEEVMTYRRGVS